MSKKERAFTLIEVLVVVSILGVLMGLVSVLVMRAGSHQRSTDAEQLVTAYLPNLIERYNAEFQKWPPGSLKELNKIKAWREIGLAANTTNESIECLVVSLRHPDFSTKLGDGDVPGSNPFGNTDADEFNQEPAGSSTPNAMEIIDPWGMPIIYIPKNLYGQTFQVMNAEGDEVDVEAVRRSNGTYYNQSKFQIISLGKNGRQDEPGAGDDFTNFKVDEDE